VGGYTKKLKSDLKQGGDHTKGSPDSGAWNLTSGGSRSPVKWEKGKRWWCKQLQNHQKKRVAYIRRLGELVVSKARWTSKFKKRGGRKASTVEGGNMQGRNRDEQLNFHRVLGPTVWVLNRFYGTMGGWGKKSFGGGTRKGAQQQVRGENSR